MRRPDIKHIITKGILALRKGISLVTKGIIDQKIGGKERVGVTIFIEELFKIRGIKSFEFEFIYKIQGNRVNRLVHVFALSGKRTTPIEEEYLVKALLERQLTNITELIGKKEFETAQELGLTGRKRFDLIEDLNIAGTKRFDFDLDRQITASRLFNIVENKKLIGKKEIDIDDRMLVKGKRDLTQIMEVLDLI